MGGGEGQLSDLIDLVDKETSWVNDLLFSRDAASQYISKPDKHDQIDRRRKLKTYMTKNREASESVKRPACDEDHDLEGCQVYLTNPWRI